MIVIQKKGKEAIPLIRELTYQVWPQTYASILTPEQIHYMLERMYSQSSLEKQITEDHHQFIVAYEKEEPIAFASYSPKPGEEEVYRLHKLYCLPQTQGRGIGRKLLDYISEDVRPKGAAAIELNVNRDNTARNFYEKLGFTVVKEEDIDIGGGYFMNDYVMRKLI